MKNSRRSRIERKLWKLTQPASSREGPVTSRKASSTALSSPSRACSRTKTYCSTAPSTSLLHYFLSLKLHYWSFWSRSKAPGSCPASTFGATDADTRGWLETAVRVHRFGEFAQTHACRRSVCARLCAQIGRRRRNLGPCRAAARFRLRALAQSRARARSGASFRGRKDFARAGLFRGNRPRDHHARGLLRRAAPNRAGAHAICLRRDCRLPDRLRVRAPVEKYFGPGSRFGEAPHERQPVRQRRVARGLAQRRRRDWRAAGKAHRLLHRRFEGTRRRPRPARLAVRFRVTGGYSQRCAYNISAAPNSMLAITRVTTPAVNHLERMAVRKNDVLPSSPSGTTMTGESSAGSGAGGVTGRSRYSILATKL